MNNVIHIPCFQTKGARSCVYTCICISTVFNISFLIDFSINKHCVVLLIFIFKVCRNHKQSKYVETACNPKYKVLNGMQSKYICNKSHVIQIQSIKSHAIQIRRNHMQSKFTKTLMLPASKEVTVRVEYERSFTTKETISIFPLWTFHLYVATFQQHLHMEYKKMYISFS